jgi:hypothetical protein
MAITGSPHASAAAPTKALLNLVLHEQPHIDN